jgi:hypothetical protein
VLLGSDLHLHCQGHDANDPRDPDDPDTTLTFSWLLNGVDIVAEAAVYENHTLYIPRVSEASLGVYECAVTDTETNVTETSALATVVEACEYRLELLLDNLNCCLIT